MISRTRYFAIAALFAATPLTAAEPLAVEAGKAWTHPHSGIVIPANLGGNARTSATSFVAEDLDVGLSFDAENSSEALTVYIYRNTNGSVPVWFSQAQWSLENRDIFKGPVLALAPSAFTPPGQSAASGLLAIYDLKGAAGYRGAGVALFQVGDWYVKLRATSTKRSAADTATWINGVIADLKVPAARAATVAPIADCTEPLALPAAPAINAPAAGPVKQVAGVTAPAARIEANLWCRDASLGGNKRTYRPVGTNDRYLLAVGDNGNAVSVRGETGAGSTPGYYSVNLVTAGVTLAITPQNRLPTPERAVELAAGNGAIDSFATWPPR